MALIGDNDGVRVGGFVIKNFVSTQGKKEDDQGTLKITLEANKDEINTSGYQLGDILAAFNVHQEGQQPIVVKVLMPQNVETPQA